MRLARCDSCGREVTQNGEDPILVMGWHGVVPDPDKPRVREHPRRPEIKVANLHKFHMAFELCLDCAKRVNESVAEVLLMELSALYSTGAIDEVHVQKLIKGELERRDGGHEEVDLDDEIPF